MEEKLKYRAELEKGGYNGYKPLGLRVRTTYQLHFLLFLLMNVFVGSRSWDF